jgi:anti-anti-sigma regulatory factor
MLKIRISIQGDLTILILSGRIEGEGIPQLENLISAEKRQVVLDLREVTLAGLAGVRFLARCEKTGIKIQNCPAYIREWISREQETS